jgi:hypothetical protein
MRLLLDHDCGGMNVHTALSVRPDWDRALNARSPSKLTPVPGTADLHGVSQKLASDSEGTSGSRARTRRSRRPTADGLKRPQPALRPHQPQARRRAAGVGRRQRLRILKRNHRKTAHSRRTQPQPFGAGPARSPFAGTPPRAATRESVKSYAFREVPADRRSSQASTTRLAMPPSAAFPHARGSYAFLLPTSPSTFSTPS